MRKTLENLVGKQILRSGLGRRFYKRLCSPNSSEWAKFLARWGGLHSVGIGVNINVDCCITDPSLVSIGNNVTLSTCTLICHDGVIGVLNTCYGKKLDAVGPITIKDNCFIGHGAIVMPRVTVGPNSIVAAGSVVTKDVLPGLVVGGNPAKLICTTDELVERIESRSAKYPWNHIIQEREGAFDPELEPILVAMRVAHFFSRKNGESSR